MANDDALTGRAPSARGGVVTARSARTRRWTSSVDRRGGLPAPSLMGTSNGSPTECRRGRGSSRRDRRASPPAMSGRRPFRRTVQGTLPAPMTPPHCVARAATGYDMPLDRLLAQVTRTRWDRLPPESRTVAADAGGSPGGPLLSGGDKRRQLGSKGQRPGAGCSSATTTAYSTARLGEPCGNPISRLSEGQDTQSPPATSDVSVASCATATQNTIIKNTLIRTSIAVTEI